MNLDHVTIIFKLFDIYSTLSKAQHGVSRINQIPWEYDERILHLKEELKQIKEETYKGYYEKHKQGLLKGVLPTGFPVVTEPQRPSRRVTAEEESPNAEIMKRADIKVKKYATTLTEGIDRRLTGDKVTEKIKKVFKEWKEDELEGLVTLANSSERHYGELQVLRAEYQILHTRFSELSSAKDDISKWLMISTKKNLYAGISNILHLALCCFVKAPLEATVETIGSVINQHGRKNRCSLRNDSLSNEVQVAWNGPQEFQRQVAEIIEDALNAHFAGTETGIRFYARSKLKLASSTINDYIKKRSRILFYDFRFLLLNSCLIVG